jgi:outer membrane biosynthesis protein TonB
VSTVVTTPPVTGQEPMSVATTTLAPTVVYTASDSDVMPAMLLRPVLPAMPPPDVPPSQIGTLELVVDEQGDVERVRLISPPNRYHERMLVAHAKTWKFRPAIRDGQPVKFRTVVRLTI